MDKKDKKEKKEKYGFAAHPENINRNGRPKKGYSLTDRLKLKLEDEMKVIRKTSNGKEIEERMTYADALIEKLLAIALNENGDRQAIKDIVERLEGKPLQQVVGELFHKIIVDTDDSEDGDEDERE